MKLYLRDRNHRYKKMDAYSESQYMDVIGDTVGFNHERVSVAYSDYGVGMIIGHRKVQKPFVGHKLTFKPVHE